MAKLALVKDLSGASVALGATAVVAALGAVGISGDLLPRLVRNEPVQAAGLVSLAIVAVLLLLVTTPWVRVVALVVLGAALTAIVVQGVSSLSDREQPALDLSWSHAEGERIQVDVSGRTESLRTEERMLVQLVGFTTAPSPDDLEEDCTTSRRRDDDNGDDDANLTVLSWQESGPDARGAVASTGSVQFPVDAYAVVCALAESRDRNPRSAADDRYTWGYVLLP